MLPIEQFLDWSDLKCPCGRPHKIYTRRVALHNDAVEELPDLVRPLLDGQRVTLVADGITYALLGARVRAVLEGAGYRLQVVKVPDYPGVGHPVCARDSVDQLATQLEPADWIIGVGAGTVNDVAKLLSFEAEVPYVTVPTAASMNGYTSSIVALLDSGVKTTIPAHQPVAVVGDPRVLVAAPAEMVQAGVGDLLSKPVCNTDWVLAREILGEYFCHRPSDMVDAGVNAIIEQIEAIRDGDPEAATLLMETIVLSGFSMSIAGTSSPASGAEHLISHYWDMGQYAAGRGPLALHGTQVGVGSIITARLYSRLLALDELPDPVLTGIPGSESAHAAWIAARHHALPAGVVEGIRQQSWDKWQSPDQAQARAEEIRRQWPALRTQMREASSTRNLIRPTLEGLGAPLTPGELGVSREKAVETVQICRDMRSRYTLFDLLALFGLLDDWAAEVVDH